MKEKREPSRRPTGGDAKDSAHPRRGTGAGATAGGPRKRSKGEDTKRKRRSMEESKLSSAEEQVLQANGLRPDKLMGKGAYSRVRKCRRESDGLWVAVKIIDRNKASERFLTAFLPRELEISATLLHPNLIRLHGHFSQGNYTCLTMELAPRGDLEQYITLKGAILPDNPFNANDEVHSTCRQILEGLGFIHNLGMAHRDLKCENIFLGEDLRPKIGDFGFARRVAPEELSRTYCGSPAYAAPELLSQIPYKARSADLWSIGIIFYILFSARMPFDDSDIPKMVSRQKAGKIPFSKEYFDANAKSFIQALLSPDPELRPTFAQALRNPWFTGSSPH